MFFKHVYGRIQLHPYLHVIALGLPRRYYGILRIFNLQLEQNPHLFLKHCSDSLADYGVPSTSKPQIQAHQKYPPYAINRQLKLQNEICEDKGTNNSESKDGSNIPPRKTSRRSRKKTIVTIQLQLDDDAKTLKSKVHQMEDGKQKTCLIVIKKTSLLKRDRFNLTIMHNNRTISQPYSKLLKKNHRKKNVTGTIANDIENVTPIQLEDAKVPSSFFSCESVYPHAAKNYVFNKNKELISNDILSRPEKEQSSSENNRIVDLNSRDYNKNLINEKFSAFGLKKDTTRMVSKNYSDFDLETSQLVPSQLVPVRDESKTENREKPLRTWPIITQIFNRTDTEIYQNYLTTSQNDDSDKETNNETNNENKEGEIEETKEILEKKEDEADSSGNIVKKTMNPKKESWFSAVKISTFLSNKNSQQTKNTNYIQEFKTGKSAQTSFAQIDFYKMNEQGVENSSKITSSHENNLEEVQVDNLTLSQSPDVVQENISNENLFSNEFWKISYPKYPPTESLINMRLLSSSMRTYESIPISETEGKEFFQIITGEGYGKENSNEKKAVDGDGVAKPRKLKKVYLLLVLMAVFLSFATGIIIFIALSDKEVIVNFEKYFST